MLLALDTATATASLAFYDLERDLLLAESTWQARRRHTQEMLTIAQGLLDRLGRRPDQVTALAATTGPGSFTGVRIALSTIKGIGLGLPRPPRAVGLPTLCVTAAPWLGVAPPQATVWAYIQAGRGRYNWCTFRAGELLRRPGPADHQAGTATEFAAALADQDDAPIWLVGEPDDDLLMAVKPLAHVTPVDAISALRRAGQLARLAALHLAEGHEDDLAALQPLYLQGP